MNMIQGRRQGDSAQKAWGDQSQDSSPRRTHTLPTVALCNAMQCNELCYSEWKASHIKMHFASICCIALRYTGQYTALKCTVVCDFGGNYILRPPTVSMAVTNNYPPTPNWDSEQFWPKISHCTTQGSNCFQMIQYRITRFRIGEKVEWKQFKSQSGTNAMPSKKVMFNASFTPLLTAWHWGIRWSLNIIKMI